MQYKNPQQKHYGTGMLASLMKFFGVRGHSQKSPSGNRAASPERQMEIISAARAKRERKLLRPVGWYNG